MTQLVINLSRVTQQVGIIDGEGRKTSFRLMARGRVETEYEIDPNWIAHNRDAIKVVKLTPVVDSTPAAETAPTSTSSKSTKAAKADEGTATSIASESTPAEGAQ
jgi:hypothetical protein